jgi:energy-coupling factor transporter ATP-binding protein EcfA2
MLTKMTGDKIPKIVEDSEIFFENKEIFKDFIEYLYNFWRNYFRIIICDSEGDVFDRRPYRTFNRTIEMLTSLVRKTYRDVVENLTGVHPRAYRQVIAGAEIATIALPIKVPYPAMYEELCSISMIRQILLYSPLIFDPPMNKRSGKFKKVDRNPMDFVDLDKGDWLCYPAKVGELLIYVYLHKNFYELGLSMCNLFDIAHDEDMLKKPDGIYFFGLEYDLEKEYGSATVFYEDKENDIFVAAAPNTDEIGYFGYLKKMVLTLYNATVMKQGRLPFHGALVKIVLRDGKFATILVIGDSGAGKSETLTALSEMGGEYIEELIVVADDMGSLDIDENGNIIGYGTEIGAFLRLDDLSPGYAFGQIDRAIIMSPNRVNARILMPITTFETIIKGAIIDYILYANNYESSEENENIIERFSSAKEALEVFREGKVASKGTTTSTGIVKSYFANIFGPPEYIELHDKLADKFFAKAFEKGIYVGQMRTRLGIPGWERKGPEMAAKELLEKVIKK